MDREKFMSDCLETHRDLLALERRLHHWICDLTGVETRGEETWEDAWRDHHGWPAREHAAAHHAADRTHSDEAPREDAPVPHAPRAPLHAAPRPASARRPPRPRERFNRPSSIEYPLKDNPWA